jgi:transposase
MLCDALGRPLRLLLTGGEKADCQSAPALLAGQSAKAVIADKGYDAKRFERSS